MAILLLDAATASESLPDILPFMSKPSFVFVVAASLLLASLRVPAVQAAPPANDNIANAIEPTDIETGETGTTVDATMDSGEPFPTGYNASSYHGTVWWKWTPPFSGWYEVTTDGSATDTVLAVWSGSTYGSLSLVHVNDESPAGSYSRIRFFAVVDLFNPQPYLISVASKTASRGAVALSAFQVSDPISTVTATTLSATTVDVGASAANITFDIALTSTSTFETGTLKLYGPSNNVVASTPVVPANLPAGNRISGNQANGVYRMTITIPQGSAAGTYRWGISMSNTSGTQTTSWGRENFTPLPFGVPASITVNNTPVDPFVTWTGVYGLSENDALRTGDPDKDGLTNLIEYQSGLSPLLGTKPTVVVTGNSITQTGLPAITVVGTGDQRRLRVVFLRRLGDSTVSATVQFGDNLTGWSNAAATPTVLATSATHEALVVEDEIFVPARERRFGRVGYTYTP